VVVVDVLRAFTTAAYAFDRGADEILLVSTVDEAFELRKRQSSLLLMGEVDGLPIDGFDLPNSPSALESLDLSMKRLVQRTTAGTQGVVLANEADHLFVASLCVASATAERIKALAPDIVTFVETGVGARGGGEEDVACADYISSLLIDSPLNLSDIRSRVLNSRAAAKFASPESPDFPRADLEYALGTDQFPFAMKVGREDGLLILRPVR
jgi:2-phosphosulfolactate phosphatase